MFTKISKIKTKILKKEDNIFVAATWGHYWKLFIRNPAHRNWIANTMHLYQSVFISSTFTVIVLLGAKSA